jgi:lycopene beta-cyclase
LATGAFLLTIMMRHYDIIIIGAGISGITLAYYLDKLHNSHFKICILEKNPTHFPKYISFWGTDFAKVPTILKSWNKIEVISPTARKSFPLKNNHFHLLRSNEYLEFLGKSLSSNITIIYENVLDIEQINNSCRITTDTSTYITDIVFDSRFESKNEDSMQFMSGAGLHITTSRPYFNPEEIILMDSRTAKSSLFFYVLPLSENEAIIESAEISLKLPAIDANLLKTQLKEYIENTLKIFGYQESSYEHGIIPLITKPLQRVVSSRIFKIGTAAGLVNPMTSFGFANILNDSKVIAETISTKFPEHIKFFTKRHFYKVLNQMTSKILSKDPTLQSALFNSIIRSKNGDDILNFLGESQNPLKCLMYMISIGDLKLITRLAHSF